MRQQLDLHLRGACEALRDAEQKYASVAEFRGSLGQQNWDDPAAFARAHYIHAPSSYTPLFLQGSGR